MKNDSMAYVPK